MHRGCISLGEARCDDCNLILPHGVRYLIVEEADGKTVRWCMDCCLKRGYAGYKVEKREQVLSFFVERENT
ncbi:hypothetical protein ACFLUH_00560 [Chloroflexota bacterium]